MRGIFRFEFGYPAVMVGGLAFLSTHSPMLGLVFGVGTWTLAYVFVRRGPPALDPPDRRA